MKQSINLNEIKKMGKWYKRQPDSVRKATASMLNDFAFGTRTEAIKDIDRTMVVRNKGFVSNRMRVTKTSLSESIDRQKSSTGSLPKERFTGWAEQEGTPTARGRVATLTGRGGSKEGLLRQSARLKQGTTVVKIGEEGYTPRGGNSNYGGFIAMLFRRKERRIFTMGKGFFKLPSATRQLPGPTTPGEKGYMAPLYRALNRVQEKKKVQPKANHWMRDAKISYFHKTDIDKLWNANMKRFTRPPKLG